MSDRSSSRRPAARGLALIGMLAAAVLGGASPATSGTNTAQAGASPVPAKPLTPLTVGLGYIANVQFAPFYFAQQSGAYATAGLDVTLQYLSDQELVPLVAQGTVDIGLSDGTSIITARSQLFPVKYAATVYADFPSVVMAKQTSGIATAADLRGHSLGTPGRYGSSWIMLQALLGSAGLTSDDLAITVYPDYGQGVALAQDQVDAATGYVNNEAVQLELEGIPVDVLAVDDIVPLPGPGLVVGEAALAAKAGPLATFVAVTLGAMEHIRADPQAGLDATVPVVPEIASDMATQRAILDATIAAWSNGYTDVNGLGAIDPAAWDASVAFMTSMPDSPVAGPVVAGDAFTTALLPVR